MTGQTSAALRHLRDVGRHDLAGQLDRFFAVLVAKASADAAFAHALANAISIQANVAKPGQVGQSQEGRLRGGRRPPGPFDPHSVYREGEEALRGRLRTCDIEQLKNIIAEHGMDHDRLAMKWKTTERLVDRIVETVVARAHKGDVFRSPGPPRPSDSLNRPLCESHAADTEVTPEGNNQSS